jgi:hypothetical protein
MGEQPESSTQEVLAGLVDRVTYHNAENGLWADVDLPIEKYGGESVLRDERGDGGRRPVPARNVLR